MKELTSIRKLYRYPITFEPFKEVETLYLAVEKILLQQATYLIALG